MSESCNQDCSSCGKDCSDRKEERIDFWLNRMNLRLREL